MRSPAGPGGGAASGERREQRLLAFLYTPGSETNTRLTSWFPRGPGSGQPASLKRSAGSPAALTRG
eukprot:3847760-Prymnesium_polylepis.1